MNLNKFSNNTMTHTYKQLTSLDRDSQDRVRKRFITYGKEDKILVDEYGRPCVQLVGQAIEGYSYFPIRKEYVYGSHKAYNRD